MGKNNRRVSKKGWLKIVVIVFIIAVSFTLTDQNYVVKYKDITKHARFDFKYTFGDYHYENILESSGSGVTIFDYNNDRLMDIFMMNGTYIEGISSEDGTVFRDTRDKLYKNNGDGTFTDVAPEAGLDDPTWSMAAGAIDYDNDGDEDLYLLNYGPNIFYRNNGDGTFTDITDEVGLKGPDMLNGFLKWSIGVSFLDYNHDNRLDAMVGNFLAFDSKYISTITPGMMPHPSEYMGQASMLYEQQPDGTFIDVTEENNLFYPDSKCMGLTVYDFDDDGDLDIFQANDHQLNFMFKNENGTFHDVGVEIGVAANNQGRGTGSMHGTIGDIDGDGLIDILVADLTHGALYRNLGNGLFEDITESSGVLGPLAGKGSWASVLFDYDNDGDLDIFASNGIAEELILTYPVLLENDGKGHFSNSGPETGKYFSTKRSGRGCAVVDYDNDGDLDIVVSHVDLTATAILLRNDGGNKNHWLGLTLKGKNSPASAIAAKVIVKAGGKKQVLINQWSTGYLSNNDPRLHIGLGKENKIDIMEIYWSDGEKETYNNISADRYITILQGKGILSGN